MSANKSALGISSDLDPEPYVHPNPSTQALHVQLCDVAESLTHLPYIPNHLQRNISVCQLA